VIPIARHRTALSRIDLSRPLKTAQADGLLNTETSVLDYGCGRGGDVRYLRHHGYQIEGWDPVHAPGGKRTEADLVNLGYVVNVIENPAEQKGSGGVGASHRRDPGRDGAVC
jgi:DNA phosphorothioation-associated putative methyltransferase